MADLSTQIKDALKKAGLDEGLADQIKVEKAEDIDKAVNELKEGIAKFKDMSNEEFIKTTEQAGMADALKRYVTSEADRRVTEAIKTHEGNLKTQKEKDEAEAQAKADLEKSQEGLSEDQKKLTELVNTVGTLAESVNKLTQNTSKKDIFTAITSALKEAGLDEGFVDIIHVESIEEVGDAVKNLSDKVLTGQQQALDKKLEDLGIPASGNTAVSSSDNDITSYAKKKSEEIGGGGVISEQLKDKKKE